MEFRSEDARQQYDALLAVLPDVVVGVDFDGTLSPIVADPASAVIHPDGPEVLVALTSRVRAVAIITGRPAPQVVELGGLGAVADALPVGSQLLVRGQYGNERWSSTDRTFVTHEVPEGLAAFRAELPALLAAERATDAYIEEKGLSVAVHTRRLPDAAEAFARLEPEVADAAARHGLALEPGRLVLEVRAPGMHKGHALREVVAETDAGGVVFVGDDLGDLEAFEEARALRAQGLPALLVCSGSTEQQQLAEIADLVVDGPDGVMELFRQLSAADGPSR